MEIQEIGIPSLENQIRNGRVGMDLEEPTKEAVKNSMSGWSELSMRMLIWFLLRRSQARGAWLRLLRSFNVYGSVPDPMMANTVLFIFLASSKMLRSQVCQ